MRTFSWALVLAGAAAVALGAQQTSSTGSTAQPAQKSTKLVTLVGCVSGNDDAPGQYTISDKDGTTYRLTGTDVRQYIGRQVEVTGASPKKFVVAGGLWPSPNAAAQAGAVDPPPAAATPPATSVAAPVAEFRVKSVKTVQGACPEK